MNMVAGAVPDAIGPDLGCISGVATAALMNERQFFEKAEDEENDRKWVCSVTARSTLKPGRPSAARSNGSDRAAVDDELRTVDRRRAFGSQIVALIGTGATCVSTTRMTGASHGSERGVRRRENRFDGWLRWTNGGFRNHPVGSE